MRPPRARPLPWILASGLLLAAGALLGCVSGPPKSPPASARAPLESTPPRPGADFPNPESFYPLEPKHHFIEGMAVLHFCTDATGRLSDAPTLAASSGNADLDSAAVLLATAGNGHFRAATRDGVAVSGCGKFAVRFVLFHDPRWPTISARVVASDARLVEGLEAWSRDFGMSAPLAVPATAAEQLALFREAGRKAAAALEPLQQLLNQYLTGIDQAAAAADVPQAERQAFFSDWDPTRARLRQSCDDAVSELRSLISVFSDSGSFLQTLPPHATADALKGKSRARWEALKSRGRVLSEQFNATLRVIQMASPNRLAAEEAAEAGRPESPSPAGAPAPR
jgi:TonB family protein